MNTIPSIFNERQINHTVLGGEEVPSGEILMPVTCVVLNRGSGQYRERVFEGLCRKGFERIISVESDSQSFKTEPLARRFPQVKFMVALEEGITEGDMLNLAVSECQSPYMLVVHSDQCADDISFSPGLAHSLMERDQFCVCPRLMAERFKNLPVGFEPGVERSVFTVRSLDVSSDGDSTFYAADLSGFYDRLRFAQLGGMDYTITNPYWQRLDLFFRAWLWGESTSLSQVFALSYSDTVPENDISIDRSYLRFYMKNLLPVFRADHAFIPASSFFAFKSSSSCSLKDAARQFREARRWVSLNRYRFKKDAQSLIENWQSKGGGK